MVRCERGKKRYRTEREASAAAPKAAAQYGQPHRWYACDMCGGWHLTTRKIYGHRVAMPSEEEAGMTSITKAADSGLVPQRGTRDEARLIREQLAPKASDAEIRVFLALCQRLDLDPFARQIYLVGRWDSRASREVFAPQVSIDGFRLVAQRTGEYAGQAGPEWCAADGVWRDVWLSPDAPVAARVGVYRKGWAQPLYRVALWSEFQQTKKDGKPSGLWAKMPSVMLAKCAEMQALRAAFPNELSGVYGVEEMAQSTPVEVVREPEPPHDAEAVNALLADLDACTDLGTLDGLKAEARALWKHLSTNERMAVASMMEQAQARAAEAASEGSCGDGEQMDEAAVNAAFEQHKERRVAQMKREDRGWGGNDE